MQSRQTSRLHPIHLHSTGVWMSPSSLTVFPQREQPSSLGGTFKSAQDSRSSSAIAWIYTKRMAQAAFVASFSGAGGAVSGSFPQFPHGVSAIVRFIPIA